MKGIYWRPHKVSKFELVVVMLVALAGFLAVEHFRVREPQPNLQERMAAARKMSTAMTELRKIRLELGYEIDPMVDPAKSGVLGVIASSVTSNLGHLKSKQTTANPNFAAVIVEWLYELDVKKGDLVAVGASGSFPGLNLAVYSALEVIGAEPVVISSASASQYGANLPELLWVDMERILVERGRLKTRSVAASRGGIKDRAAGMAKSSRKLLDQAVARNGLPLLEPKSLLGSINVRMKVFDDYAGDRPYAAYINIGGGTSSVGTAAGKKLFTPGVNRKAPPGLSAIDSVMGRFIKRGVPLIHLTRIKRIAAEHGLPYGPRTLRPVGEGTVYTTENYNRWLAGGVIVLLLGMLYLIFRTSWGARTLGRFTRREIKPPEPMV